MLYGFVFLALAVQLAAFAALLGGWAFLLLWPACSVLIVALSYFGLGSRVFGKRSDGTRRLWATTLLLPYLAFVAVVWWFACRLSREPIRHEVAPNLFLGRRVAFHELPPGCELVIDLTCEFVDQAAIRRSPGYACLPTLDASTPDPERFRAGVNRAATCSGVVFVHCAQGHGRSGLFVAALIIARGLATDARQAVRLIRAVRPGMRLKPNQFRFLEEWVRSESRDDVGR